MKYRAVLIEPGNTTQERPYSTLTNSWKEIEDWTKRALERSEDPYAWVDRFETVENFRSRVNKSRGDQ